MKKKSKIVLITVLIVIVTPITLLYMTVANSVDCDQMVIDSYELHSNINIPSVSFINCYYDKATGMRVSVYDLNSSISMEKFNRIDQSKDADFLTSSFLLEAHEKPESADLYMATGEKWGTQWTYLLDKKTNRLWAELNYQ